MSLVNDSLKFTSSDTQICWNFLLKKNVSSFCIAKATHIFSAKNIWILYIESAKTVNEMTLNELVKLTTLWTTGPCTSTMTVRILAFGGHSLRGKPEYSENATGLGWVTLQCHSMPGIETLVAEVTSEWHTPALSKPFTDDRKVQNVRLIQITVYSTNK